MFMEDFWQYLYLLLCNWLKCMWRLDCYFSLLGVCVVSVWRELVVYLACPCKKPDVYLW